jgi:hypothetical protein
MEKAVVFAILEFTQTALSGKPSLHPPLIYSQNQLVEEQRQKLYGECDRQLETIKGYDEHIKPLGVFERPWIREEELPNGYLTEQLLGVLGRVRTTLRERLLNIYDENIERVDRALIEGGGYWVTRCYNFVMRKKLEILGRFPAEQGEFYLLLKVRDHMNALRHSYRMTHLAFDRLRGHRLRLDALDKSMITATDKKKIITAMSNAWVNNESELRFWHESYLYLRTLYDLMIQVEDGHRLVLYKQKTMIPSDAIRLEKDEFYLRSIKVELPVSFFNDRCQKRQLGFISRGVLYPIQTLGSLYSSAVGATEPRSFDHLSTHIALKIKTDMEAIKPYEETVTFAGSNKPFLFFEAVVNDHWALATQIAFNGHKAKNIELNWDKEFKNLRTYRNMLKSLFGIQDESVKLKASIALKFNEKRNSSLDALFVELDMLEYQAQQARKDVMLSYQKSIFVQLQNQETYVKQITETVKDKLTRYLMRNEIFEKTPVFETYIGTVRDQISKYHGRITEISDLMGIQRPAIPEELYGEASLATSHDLTHSMRSEVSQIPQPLLSSIERPLQSSSSILSPASRAELDLFGLEAYSRFSNAEGYLQFVRDPQFFTQKRIIAAIEFCRQNTQEEISGWLWEQEEADLRILLRFIKQIDELASSSKPTQLTQSSPKENERVEFKIRLTLSRLHELKEELMDSYRTDVITKYGRFLRSQDKTWWESIKTNAYLIEQSSVRKGWRVLVSGTYKNTSIAFHDPEYRARLEILLGLKSAKEIPEEEMQEMLKEFEDSPEGSTASGAAKAPIVESSSQGSSALKPSAASASLDSLPPRLDASESPLSPSPGPSIPGSQTPTEGAGTQSSYWGLASLSRLVSSRPAIPYMPSMPSLQSLTSSLSWRKPAESPPPVAPVSSEKEGVPKSPSDGVEDKKK